MVHSRKSSRSKSKSGSRKLVGTKGCCPPPVKLGGKPRKSKSKGSKKKPTRKLAYNEALCMKHRDAKNKPTVEKIVSGKIVKMKNNRTMIKAISAKGCPIYKLIGAEVEAKLRADSNIKITN